MVTIGDLEKLAGMNRNDGNTVRDFYLDIDRKIMEKTGGIASGNEVITEAVWKLEKRIKARILDMSAPAAALNDVKTLLQLQQMRTQ